MCDGVINTGETLKFNKRLFFFKPMAGHVLLYFPVGPRGVAVGAVMLRLPHPGRVCDTSLPVWSEPDPCLHTSLGGNLFMSIRCASACSGAIHPIFKVETVLAVVKKQVSKWERWGRYRRSWDRLRIWRSKSVLPPKKDLRYRFIYFFHVFWSTLNLNVNPQ